MGAVVIGLALAGGGCSGPASPCDADLDAGADALLPDSAPPAPPSPEAPSLPVLTPCPAGWRQIDPDDEGGAPWCDPWPVGGYQECAVDEAHFPGEAGCVRVGSACPTGDWAEDLPTEGTVLYVRAGEASGGDGSREAPFGSIADALAAAPPGAVVALSRGAFDEAPMVPEGVTLWGACVAGTVVAPTTSSDFVGTINVRGADVVVRNLQVGGARIGIWLPGGSYSVHVEDVVVAGATVAGWMVAQGSATGRTVVIRDTEAREGGQHGRGVNVESAGRIELSRALVEGNRDFGVFVGLLGTASLDGVAVRRTRSRELGAIMGRGLQVENGAEVTVVRSVFEHNRDASVFATNADTTLSLSEVLIRDTAPEEVRDHHGIGLGASQGGQVEAERVVVATSLERGVLSDGPGTRVLLRDVVVRGSQPRLSDGTLGRGVGVGRGGLLEAERLLVDECHEAGIFVTDDGTSVTLSDVVVRRMRSRPVTGILGRGLHLQHGAEATVFRARFDECREVAVCASHPGTSALLDDVTVEDTLERECASSACPDRGGGTGLASLAEAHVEARRFLVTRSALAGVQVARGDAAAGLDGGTMELHGGEVSSCPVGANVQTPGFDVARLFDDVLYRDNGRDLDATELPLPDLDLGDLDGR